MKGEKEKKTRSIDGGRCSGNHGGERWHFQPIDGFPDAILVGLSDGQVDPIVVLDEFPCPEFPRGLVAHVDQPHGAILPQDL